MTFRVDMGDTVTDLVLLVVLIAAFFYILSFLMERAVKKGTLAAMRELKREEAARDRAES